ncbi:Reticulon-domain-containing protein, partial [Gongronella butleri]
DPSGYLVTKLQSLMYWEHPAQSFGVLFGLLCSVYLSQSYSLLYLASAAFTLITAFNWVYVNLHYHSHRVLSGKPAEVIVHPHSDALSMRDARRTWFTEEQVNHSCQVALNVLEGVVEQVMELVLIEDSWRSGCAVAISFILWTLASLISTKSLVVLLTVLFFTVPRLYLEHQVDVDAYAMHQQNRVKSWLKEHQQQQVMLYKLSERAQTLALQLASKGMQLAHTLYSQWANRKSAVSIVTEQPMDHAK